MLPFPQTAESRVLKLNGVWVLLNSESLTLCLFAASWVSSLNSQFGSCLIWIPGCDSNLAKTSQNNYFFSVIIIIIYSNCKMCWRYTYISFRASPRLDSSCKGPAHYHMHGGRREKMHTCIFSLGHASEGRLNYARPSSSARTYHQ